MNRLTSQQVGELRETVEASVRSLEQKRIDAYYRKPQDPKEIAYYEECLRRQNALLAALPKRGGVQVDDTDDEQRGESQDEGWDENE